MATARTISTVLAGAAASCALAGLAAPAAVARQVDGPAGSTSCFDAAPPAQTTFRAPAARTPSYDWPLMPFGRQHPVRGYFNDPRDGARHSHSFHFGIDIAAADGTPVYAVQSGRAYLSSARAVAVRDRPGHVLSYWHVVPVVRDGQAVSRHQLLGHVEAPWKHVHFAEVVDGRYVNPLRASGIGPYVDTTAPRVRGIDAHVDSRGVSIAVDAYDVTPVAVPAPWDGLPVTPVLLRWRVVGADGTASTWHTGVDFRRTRLPASAFRAVYGAKTRKNVPNRAGRFCFTLATRVHVAPDAARVEVAVSDTAGNTTTAVAALEPEAG